MTDKHVEIFTLSKKLVYMGDLPDLWRLEILPKAIQYFNERINTLVMSGCLSKENVEYAFKDIRNMYFFHQDVNRFNSLNEHHQWNVYLAIARVVEFQTTDSSFCPGWDLFYSGKYD